MAPPLTSGGLIARLQTSRADTIGARIAKHPRVGYGHREESRLTTKKGTMRAKFVAVILLCLVTSAAMAQEAKVTSLMSKELAENPGKEVLMITVEYPPGSVDRIHRHNAQAFVYLLEGSIVMQVRGGKEVTLTPGQTFYEGPDDVHVVGRNASATEPAKFLVVLIKNKGAPVLVPAQ